MRHPLWILNSALFLLLIIAICFALFAREPLPEWEDITPSYNAPIQKKASEITISKIYEHDLFGTYEKEFVQPELPDYIIPLPPAPAPRQVAVPVEPVPQFLEPLKIQLKGIIVVLNDDTKNRAIIMDARTNKEEIYKIGDTIEDAQLIKIFGKKVIFLRSNGQQEVLYLRPKDAQMDPLYAVTNTYKDVVQELSEYEYLVSRKEFSRRIKSLAQFIDLLDLTTVYQHGASVGCRIGALEPESLGYALGLKPGDIILTINSLPATDSQNRFKIYKTIIDMKTKESIIVQLLRNNTTLTITYTLDEFKVPKSSTPPSQGIHEEKVLSKQAQQEQLNLLQERHKFAPTLQEIREKERQNMLKNGRSPRNNITAKLAEQ